MFLYELISKMYFDEGFLKKHEIRRVEVAKKSWVEEESMKEGCTANLGEIFEKFL